MLDKVSTPLVSQTLCIKVLSILNPVPSHDLSALR